MDFSSSENRLSKLPPPPQPSGSFTSIQRKSFMKQISTNGMPNSKNNETETTTIVSHNVRRVPIIRSTSTTPEVVHHQPRVSSTYGSLSGASHNGSLDNFISIELPSSALRMAARLTGGNKSHIDRYSSSSGYDSANSSTSLSYHHSNGPFEHTIRRIPSLHSVYTYSPTETSDTCTKSDTQASQSSCRTKRHSLSEKSLKDEVIHSLDRLEKRVAFLREVASELLEEKDKLLNALTQIETCCSQGSFAEVDLQDIRAASDCLHHRLACVEISIKTMRTTTQENALQQCNQCIEDLNHILNKSGKMAAKQRCLSYISSCSSDNLTDGDSTIVPIDERFQKTVIQCSLEDQKLIKRKLETILLNIEK